MLVIMISESVECTDLYSPIFSCLSFLSVLPFLLSPFPYPLYSSLQVEQFFDKGYVVVPSFFTVEEMQPAVKAVEECVDILANRLHLAGKGKEGRGRDGGRDGGKREREEGGWTNGWIGRWRERRSGGRWMNG